MPCDVPGVMSSAAANISGKSVAMPSPAVNMPSAESGHASEAVVARTTPAAASTAEPRRVASRPT